MTDTDLDVLDVDNLGVDVLSPTNQTTSSALLLVVVCVGMGLVFGLAFAVWWLLGDAWFGSSMPALFEWFGIQLIPR
ncbi:MAG TPA: hypothetical protein VN133_01030 [Humibacter sp.]|nr:hypothetical protein [Humibacter sp.]